MKPRRFLVLTPALDGADGISELSRQVVRALVGEVGSDRVETWAFEGSSGPIDGPTSPFRTARRSRLRIGAWALAKAAAPLDDLTVIVMHAHLGPLATLLARRGAHVVVFLIGVEVWRPLRPRDRRALQRADRLIAISQYTERRFREGNPDLRERPITVCPLGIGPPPPARPSAVGRDFALIVGRMWAQERYKGHDRLIDAWPKVVARLPDAQLVVAGDGDDRARLEESVAAAGLSRAIRFTGRVPAGELSGLYAASAFFVMPSTSEGFGLAYLEAMQAGKPCIAFHGAADEIIEHGVSGLVVDPDPADALVDAIVTLFADPGRCARMGAAAAERVARGFTDAHFARRLCATLGLPGAAPSVGLTCTSSV